METYERIRDLRKNHLHLSQTAFGDKLGVSRDVISNIEQNRLLKPDQKEPLYKLICKEFGISYLWLTQGIEPMKAQTDRSTMAKIDAVMTGENKAAQSIFKAFANLDESEWELLIKIIKDVSKEL